MLNNGDLLRGESFFATSGSKEKLRCCEKIGGAGCRQDHKLCLVFHNVSQCTNEPLRGSGVLGDSCEAPASQYVCTRSQTYVSTVAEPDDRL